MLITPVSASTGSICSPKHATVKNIPPLPSSPSQQRKAFQDDHCSASTSFSTLAAAFDLALNLKNERVLRDSTYSEHTTEAVAADNTSDQTERRPFIFDSSAETTSGVHNTRLQPTSIPFNANVNGGNTLGSIFGNSGALSSPSCSRIGLRSTSTSTLVLSSNSTTATEAAVAGADGNLFIQRQQLAHQQNLSHFGGLIADNTHSSNPGSVFRPILSLLAVTSLPHSNRDSQVPRDRPVSISPSWSNDDLLSPTHTSLQPSNRYNADREKGPVDAKFELCVQPSSAVSSPRLTHVVEQSHTTEDSVLNINVLSPQSFLETPPLPYEHDCRIDTPLLDLQEQGYAMVPQGKDTMPREFQERLAVITENLIHMSSRDGSSTMDEYTSSPLDARYLERSPSEPDMLMEDLSDQGCLEAVGQDEIYLIWLLQWGAIEMEDLAIMKAKEDMVASYVIHMDDILGHNSYIEKNVLSAPEEQPLAHVRVLKQVRFNPYVHTIMFSPAREDENLASTRSDGPCNSLILRLRLDLTNLPPLPDSPAQESSTFFADSELHHLLPILPMTPTLGSEGDFFSLASAESFSPSCIDEVDVSTLPPLPPSPEVDFVDSFTSKAPSEVLKSQYTNTDIDCQPPQPSFTLHNSRAKSLRLNTAPRQHFNDGADSRSWTVLKSPVAAIRHASAASPLTPASPRTIELAATRQQLVYWTQTATKLRNQEQMLTERIDTLITEMADLIDRCEASEMGLQATEDELQELQQKLADEQKVGFASIQEAALSIQENHLLGVALEETWKELDLMREAWVDLHWQQSVEQDVRRQRAQEQHPLPRVSSLSTVPCSYIESASAVETKGLAETLSCHSADDAQKPKDPLSMLKFAAVSLLMTLAMTACLLILLEDQDMIRRSGRVIIFARRSVEPVVYKYSLLARDEVLENWEELGQTVEEYAKTTIVAPVQHAIAAFSGMVEYQSEMWSLLTASSSRYSLL